MCTFRSRQGKKGKFSAYLKELAIRILFEQLLSTRYFLAKCISMEEKRVGEQKEKEKEHMIINRFQVYIRNKKKNTVEIMQENNMKYVYLENLSVAICCRVSHYVTHINIFIPHLALFSQNAFSRVFFLGYRIG